MLLSDDTERQVQQLQIEGKYVQAGWVGFRQQVIPANASQVQIDEMQKAFFAGAHHLMSSLLSSMSDGTDVAEGDVRRLALIERELNQFTEQMVTEGPLDD